MNIQPLSWNSHFFHISIGKVAQKNFRFEDIDSIYREAKKNGYTLLYLESDERLPFIHSCRGDLRLVDIKTSLQVKVTNATQTLIRWNVVEYAGSQVTPELEQLAYESGVFSRFHVDSKFPDTLFKKLYKKWIYNSVFNKSADIVFICLNNRKKPVGFV